VKVGKDRAVAIDYTIRLVDGEVIETSTDAAPLWYLHGRAQIIPGIERALDGREIGTEVEVEVAPAEAYGDHDPEGVFLVPRASFPTDEAVAPGMSFSAVHPDGEPVVFRVLQADEELVLVDTNHPLAGKTLRIWVAIRSVRDATTDELSDGHVQSRMGVPLPS
jgi:FKBP-type peptidyl-prolyl cis-trans isomerase SlyD